MNTEQQIREVLHTEVADLEPSPAGWDVIQRRVAARRRRFVLTRALPTVAGLAVLGLLIALLVPGLGDGPARLVPNPPAASSSVEPGGVDFTPLRTIFPLTTRGGADVWENDPADDPRLAAPERVVAAFVEQYVGLPAATVQAASPASAGPGLLFDVLVDDVPIARVSVRDVGRDAAPGPFVVDRAFVEDGSGAPGLTIEHDVELVVSPPSFSVSGTALDGEEAVADGATLQVILRDGEGNQLSAQDAVIDGDRWAAQLEVPAPELPTGSVLLLAMDAGGQVQSFAAAPVLFAGSDPAMPPAPPGDLVAVRDGVLGVYRTSDGTLVRTLGEAGAGSVNATTDSSGRTVVHVRTGGSCASSIHATPRSGGVSRTLVDATRGRLWSPSHNGRNSLAFVAKRCQDDGQIELVVRDLTSGIETVLARQSAWMGLSALTWSADGERLAVLQSDDMGPGGDVIRVYEPGQSEFASVLPRKGCDFTAVTWRQMPGVGRQLLTGQYCAKDGGREARVYAEFTEESRPRALLSTSPLLVRGDVPVTTLDVDPSGRYVLGAQTIRSRGIEMWHWDMQGEPVAMKVPPDLTSPTW